jgi:glutamyl-tRNA synthetase
MIRVRFAPCPIGHLFVSGARVALVNFLYARRHGGHLLLRFDDLDSERSRPAFAEAIERDLDWLGVHWDDSFRQSDRVPLYRTAVDRLKQAGLLYPCFETEEELRAKRDFRQKRNQPTVYDRAMLKLTPEQRAAAEAGGKRPHWRFRLSDRTLSWHDLVLGPRQAKLPAVSDPVLVRADGSVSPILAGVVDDIDTGITHIIRAEENAGATAIQRELFAALGADPSRLSFAHLPPLVEAGRSRLARRIGSLSLRSLRNDGVEALAIGTCLAQSVTAMPLEPAAPTDLAVHFQLGQLSSAAARFDAGQLLALNRQVLGELDFPAVAERLPNGATEAFWLAVRGCIDLLNEARGWWDVVAGTIVPPVMDGEHAFLATAQDLLPAEPWDSSVWTTWTEALGRTTGRMGDALLMPLRLALTGEEQGPDLAHLLPLMGRTRAATRLQLAAA